MKPLAIRRWVEYEDLKTIEPMVCVCIYKIVCIYIYHRSIFRYISRNIPYCTLQWTLHAQRLKAFKNNILRFWLVEIVREILLTITDLHPEIYQDAQQTLTPFLFVCSLNCSIRNMDSFLQELYTHSNDPVQLPLGVADWPRAQQMQTTETGSLFATVQVWNFGVYQQNRRVKSYDIWKGDFLYKFDVFNGHLVVVFFHKLQQKSTIRLAVWSARSSRDPQRILRANLGGKWSFRLRKTQ